MKTWPLRWTIPGIALILVLAAEAVLGIAALAVLNRTLVGQVDDRLTEAIEAIESHPAAVLRELGRDENTESVDALRPRSDVMVVVIRADGSVAQGLTRRLNDGRTVPDVTLRDGNLTPYSTRVQGETWRVLVSELGTSGTTVAVMMPLREPGAATTALRRGILVLGLAVAALAAGIAAWATSRSLRPLADAERTAAAIAAGDLTRRVPDYPQGTEAGSLAASLNVMIDRLHGALAQTEASQRRLRSFVSNASHELRTPLAAIRGYAELHRMGADTDGDAIGRIEANAERMSALVDDLLTLARSDEDASSLGGHERVDMAQVLAETAADLGAQDPSRTVSVTADDDCMVSGSRRHLRQVFANLAGNVLHHTPPGTAVELTASHDGAKVVVTVRDHGPGFGPGHAERAFERFYRTDRSRTRDTGGSGLGLAIVSAIVSAHGGTVSASDVGDGAAVTVTLPRRRTAS